MGRRGAAPEPDSNEQEDGILGKDSERAGLAPESPLRPVADGAASRVDRLKALGNAVIPAQAARAIELLLGDSDSP